VLVGYYVFFFLLLFLVLTTVGVGVLMCCTREGLASTHPLPRRSSSRPAQLPVIHNLLGVRSAPATQI
jgi:hypothetical protein